VLITPQLNGKLHVRYNDVFLDPNMAGISLARAALVSIVVQALFFGVYVTLFGFTQHIIFKDGRSSFNRTLWIASVLLFVISVVHISIDAERLQLAFNNTLTARDEFLGSLSDGTYLAKSAIYQVQTYIGDACIIYRTYMLYGRKIWVVALPLMLLVMIMVTGSGMLWAFAHAPPGSVPFEFADWAVPYVGGTLLTNLICTVLIITQIYRMTPPSIEKRELLRFTPVIVLLESGAVYTASIAVLTALCSTSSNGYTIILDLLCPIIGITFSVIILRVYSERRRQTPHIVRDVTSPAGTGTQGSRGTIQFSKSGQRSWDSPDHVNRVVDVRLQPMADVSTSRYGRSVDEHV